jgi:hypothetical protein
MIPFIINQEVRENIKKVMSHAYNNIVPIYEQAQKGELSSGDPNPVGDQDGFSLFIPTAFKVVFSVEDQGEGPRQLGLVRHLSMSIGVIGKIPNFLEVDMVLEEFGFDNPLYKCIVWGEKFGNESQTAINVIECIKGWPSEELAKQIETNFTETYGQSLIDVIKQRRNLQNGNRGTSPKSEGG